MRVTQSSLTRNYMKNLNRNISNLATSNDRLSSMRKFSRVSENTNAAAQAFTVREQLYKNEQFLNNISDAQGELSAAESNSMTVNKIMQQVGERMVQGINGTNNDEVKAIIGNEIKSLKEQIVQTMNAKFGDKFVFGGSNNSEPPFTVNAAGKLTFNGVVIDDIAVDPSTGKPGVSDGGTPPVFTPVPENAQVFVDMGLGLTMTGAQLDTKTAVLVSSSGLDVLGFGKTTIDGVEFPNNIYDFLTKVETDFLNNDMTDMPAALEQIENISEKLMLQVTDIGTRANFLDQTAERIESDTFNLTAKQDKLESLEIEKEAIYNKSYEMAWMVTLQLGSKILPPSIFDFMR